MVFDALAIVNGFHSMEGFNPVSETIKSSALKPCYIIQWRASFLASSLPAFVMKGQKDEQQVYGQPLPGAIHMQRGRSFSLQRAFEHAEFTYCNKYPRKCLCKRQKIRSKMFPFGRRAGLSVFV